MTKTTTPTARTLYIERVKLAQTLCPGSMSSVQYAAFVEHFKGRDMLRTLKIKSGSDARKLALRETTPTREQKLAAAIACESIASALKIDRNKFWTRKLFAFVAAEKSASKPRKPRAAKTA